MRKYGFYYDDETIRKAYKLLKMAYASEAFDIPIDKIKLTEQIHSKGNPIDIPEKDELLCVVRTIKNTDEYSLILGWADYHLAIRHEKKTIKAIILNQHVSRDKFVYLMTRCAVNNKPLESIIFRNRNTVIIPIDNIIISEDISVTDLKIELARKFYESFGIFKVPIIINKKNVIIDGYSSYFLARQLGMNSVDVIIK